MGAVRLSESLRLPKQAYPYGAGPAAPLSGVVLFSAAQKDCKAFLLADRPATAGAEPALRHFVHTVGVLPRSLGGSAKGNWPLPPNVAKYATKRAPLLCFWKLSTEMMLRLQHTAGGMEAQALREERAGSIAVLGWRALSADRSSQQRRG